MTIQTPPGCIATLLLLVMGCSGSGTLAESGNDVATPGSEFDVPADYEEFDATPYEEEPPSLEPVIVHDVPEALLGAPRTMQSQSGFRIQIFSTQDKIAADSVVVLLETFWGDLERRDALENTPGAPPIYQDFRSPYYRVRLGDFLTREDANQVLTVVERRFPHAFIAPAAIRLDE